MEENSSELDSNNFNVLVDNLAGLSLTDEEVRRILSPRKEGSRQLPSSTSKDEDSEEASHKYDFEIDRDSLKSDSGSPRLHQNATAPTSSTPLQSPDESVNKLNSEDEEGNSSVAPFFLDTTNFDRLNDNITTDDEQLSPVLTANQGFQSQEQYEEDSYNNYDYTSDPSSPNYISSSLDQLPHLDDEDDLQLTPIKEERNYLHSQDAPTTNALSKKISDILIPASAMKDLKDRKNALAKEFEESQPGSSLTLKEQANVIDNLRKEVFGLKLKCYFLYDQLNKFHDQEVQDIMKQNIDLKTLTMELQRAVAGYEKKISGLESRIKPDQSFNLSTPSPAPSNLITLQSRYSQALSELETTKRALAALRKEKSKKTNYSVGAYNEDRNVLSNMLDNERREKEALLQELESLRVQLSKKVPMPAKNTDERVIETLQRSNELLRMDISMQNEALLLRKQENDRLVKQVEELTVALNSGKMNAIVEAESSKNELWDSMMVSRMKTQEQSIELTRLYKQLQDIEEDYENKLMRMEQQWREDVDQLQEYVEEITQELQDTKEVLSKSSKESDDYEEVVGKLRTEAEREIEKFEKTIRENEESISLFKEEVEKLTDEITQLSERYNDKCHEFDELQKRLQTLEEENNKAKEDSTSKTSNLLEQLKMKEAEVDSLRKENEENKQVIALKESELVKSNDNKLLLNEQIESLNDQLSQLKTEMESVTTSKESLADYLSNLKERHNDELDSLNKKLREFEGILSSNSSLKNEIEERNNQYVTLRENFDSLQNAIMETFDKQVTHCSVNHLVQQIRKLKDENKKDQSGTDKLMKKIYHCEQSLKEKTNSLETLVSEKKELKNLLDAERRSKKAIQLELENLSSQAFRRNLSGSSSPSERSQSRELKLLQASEKRLKEQVEERNSLIKNIVTRFTQLNTGSKPVNTNVEALTTISSMNQAVNMNFRELDKSIQEFKRKCQSMEREFKTELRKLDGVLEARSKRLSQLEERVKLLGAGSTSSIPNSPRASKRVSLDSEDKKLVPASPDKSAVQRGITALKRDAEGMSHIWQLRLREMEFQLKAEQEGRKRDKLGARERLQDLIRQNRSLSRQIKTDKESNSRSPSISSQEHK
ncbi:MT organizer Mto1 [Schizosaccharomyces pombe]